MLQIKETLGFDIVTKVRTVYDFLQERGAEALLSEEDIEFATSEIVQKPGQARSEISDVLTSHDSQFLEYFSVMCFS